RVGITVIVRGADTNTDVGAAPVAPGPSPTVVTAPATVAAAPIAASPAAPPTTAPAPTPTAAAVGLCGRLFIKLTCPGILSAGLPLGERCIIRGRTTFSAYCGTAGFLARVLSVQFPCQRRARH